MQCFIVLQIPNELWDYGWPVVLLFLIIGGIIAMAKLFFTWLFKQKEKRLDAELKRSDAKEASELKRQEERDALELKMRMQENEEKREAHHALLTELQEVKKNISDQKKATDEGVTQLKEMNSGMNELRKDIKEIQAVQVDHGKMLRDHDMLLREHDKKISELREKS